MSNEACKLAARTVHQLEETTEVLNRAKLLVTRKTEHGFQSNVSLGLNIKLNNIQLRTWAEGGEAIWITMTIVRRILQNSIS